MIWLSVILGMALVPIALYAQIWSCQELANTFGVCGNLRHATLETLGIKVIFAWAAIEETLKYLAAAIFILPRRAVDESPDYVIYMITIALGFAAFENALYLYDPLVRGDITQSIVGNNLRFLGANLLHVISSACIGFALAFSYRKRPALRALYAAGGVILAIGLHTAFNALIMLRSGQETLFAFLLVWSTAVVFFALFEILKYWRYRRLANNTC